MIILPPHLHIMHLPNRAFPFRLFPEKLFWNNVTMDQKLALREQIREIVPGTGYMENEAAQLGERWALGQCNCLGIDVVYFAFRDETDATLCKLAWSENYLNAETDTMRRSGILVPIRAFTDNFNICVTTNENAYFRYRLFVPFNDEMSYDSGAGQNSFFGNFLSDLNGFGLPESEAADAGHDWAWGSTSVMYQTGQAFIALRDDSALESVRNRVAKHIEKVEATKKAKAEEEAAKTKQEIAARKILDRIRQRQQAKATI